MSEERFHTRLRNGSTPDRIGNGREGKRKGMEGKKTLVYSSIHRYCPNARRRIGWMP